jgi:hypothetical protein
MAEGLVLVLGHPEEDGEFERGGGRRRRGSYARLCGWNWEGGGCWVWEDDH